MLNPKIILAFTVIAAIGIVGIALWPEPVADKNPAGLSAAHHSEPAQRHPVIAPVPIQQTAVNPTKLPAPAKKLDKLIHDPELAPQVNTAALATSQKKLDAQLVAIDQQLEQQGISTDKPVAQTPKTMSDTRARLEAIKKHMANKPASP